MTKWYRIWIGSLEIEPFMVDMSGTELCSVDGSTFDLNDNMCMIRPSKVECINAVIDYRRQLHIDAVNEVERRRLDLRDAFAARDNIQDNG